MLGLTFEQLCLAFDSSFGDSVRMMREDERKLEEILGVHGDEFPKMREHFDSLTREFDEWNLSTDDIIVASYLTMLKVIETNNKALHEQLQRAGISV